MKKRQFTIFRRFTIVIFSLIVVLALLFMIITYFATTYYHEASTQLLNKEVATHIAKFTSPFTSAGIDRGKADSVFQNAMVLSPAAEVYFLDTTGKVIYFHASDKDILRNMIELEPIKNYIISKGDRYIKADDPRDPGVKKIFSAAEVSGPHSMLGYIYVILDSKKSENVISIVTDSYILNLALKAVVIIVVLSLVFSFFYIKRISKSFQRVVEVLQRFENGDYNARFEGRQIDEMKPVTHAFNKMVSLLSEAINRLTQSGQERKNFIATISHDLRTPLSIARGYMETLVLKTGDGNLTRDEQEYYSQLILSKILQIESMVKQLFELSKMDAIAFTIQTEPFVLNEIVQELVDTLQMSASERQVTLRCSDCSTMVWAQGDVSMIERVIQNLVDNALKNTPGGGLAEITINATRQVLTFKILNTGVPLSADLLQWVANSEKTDPLLVKRPSHLGLGLVIIQKMLHLHNTHLKAFVQDEFNVFSFDLPIYQHID